MTVTSDLRTRAVHAASVVDPDVMTGAQAAAAVEDLATASNAVNATLMFVALRVARTDAWRGGGHKSAADWLSAVAGVSVFEANRLLGTARKADDLDKTKQAMKDGDLSPDQADTVTDAATADPGAEDDLLGCAATDTNANLREQAAKRKAAATDSAARERRIRRNRSLRTGTDAEGAFWGRLYGPGMDAARFEALIRPFEELIFRHHRAAGRRDTYENRRYDAFFLMLACYARLAGKAQDPSAPTAEPHPAPPPDRAEAPADDPRGDGEAVAPGTAPDDLPAGPPPNPTTGPPPPGPTAGSPPGPTAGSPPMWAPPWDPDTPVPLPVKVPGGNNVKVIVTIDHTALLRGHTRPGETCEIAGVGPVPVAAVRDILRDDPFLAVVVRKGRDVVTVAHHGRGLNAHQRTAIEANGIRCTNIACNRTTAIEIDHRVPYAHDPVTKLDNQDPLCSDCHRIKTHHGHHLEPGTGRRRLLPPDNPHTAHTSDSAHDAGHDDLPTGQALIDLQNQRPLTPREADQLEARILDRDARNGRPIDPTRRAQLAQRLAQPQPEHHQQPALC
ncbi:HNH endonuclease signature motif containing protein [Aquihabitans daechungensis]|uniref:HNH endonuclease signature motif containing protein n=1 Tax=Aquihabitans daechungensis TaxID=1052257 RepID=UPI003BA11AF5